MANVKAVAVPSTMPVHRVVGFQVNLKIGPNGMVNCRKKRMPVPVSSLPLPEEVHEEDVQVEQDQWQHLVHLNKNEFNLEWR